MMENLNWVSVLDVQSCTGVDEFFRYCLKLRNLIKLECYRIAATFKEGLNSFIKLPYEAYLVFTKPCFL